MCERNFILQAKDCKHAEALFSCDFATLLIKKFNNWKG